ncbi:hypothetical protein ACIOEX_02665 [Streptomyces sp. NPDC087850]|uniref:hypothetical protein n=1 Tax=Streptomyces sp. NPDC087850 TaxID=3365809 RepID=UPI0038040A81
MTNQTRLASTDELESIFQRELATDRWAATETAYALAVRHRDLGDWPASREWAQQCLCLESRIPLPLLPPGNTSKAPRIRRPCCPETGSTGDTSGTGDTSSTGGAGRP